MQIGRGLLVIILLGVSAVALAKPLPFGVSGVIADVGTAFFQMLMFSSVILVRRKLEIPIAQSVALLVGIMLFAQYLARVFCDVALQEALTQFSLESLLIVCLMVLATVALVIFIPFEAGIHSKDSDSSADVQFGVSPEKRADLLAKAYGLTPRETEIASLLLKGRSLPYIQDELVISSGTAKTHLRHIYEKTAVHSRQELLDLAESYLSHEGIETSK